MLLPGFNIGGRLEKKSQIRTRAWFLTQVQVGTGCDRSLVAAQRVREVLRYFHRMPSWEHGARAVHCGGRLPSVTRSPRDKRAALMSNGFQPFYLCKYLCCLASDPTGPIKRAQASKYRSNHGAELFYVSAMAELVLKNFHEWKCNCVPVTQFKEKNSIFWPYIGNNESFATKDWTTTFPI